MATFVNKIEFAVGDQPVKLLATNGGVMVSLFPHTNNVGCLI